MNGGGDPLIACVDVDYRTAGAVAAGVWFRGWSADAPEHEAVHFSREVADYRPGEFYRRELPCLLGVLAGGLAPSLVIVDGYAWLGPGRPGLGVHLYEALGCEVPVAGVAKTAYAGACGVPVLRGQSRSPLHVTAVGIDPAEVARRVGTMAGAYRVPALIKRADQLARRFVPPNPA